MRSASRAFEVLRAGSTRASRRTGVISLISGLLTTYKRKRKHCQRTDSIRKREGAPYLSESLKGSVGGLSDLLVSIGDDFGQSRKDRRKGDGELTRSKVGHCSHEFDRSFLRSPLFIVETGEESREDKLDGVTTQFGHDRFCGILSSFSNIGRRISETVEEERKDFGDVRFEESSKNGREDLVTKDGTLTSLHRFLVLCVVLESSHKSKLLNRRETSTCNDSCETVSCSSSFGIFGCIEQIVEELIGEIRNVVWNDLDERR